MGVLASAAIDTSLVTELLAIGKSIMGFAVGTFPINVLVIGMVVGAVIKLIGGSKKAVK